VKRGAVRRGMGKMMVMILELRTTRKPVPVDVQCTMDDRVQQNQIQLIFLSALGQKLC